MSWQFLTAINVITFSTSVLLRRVLLHNDKSDPIAFAVVFQALVGLITLVYALVQGFVWPDFGKYWFAILITFLMFAAGNAINAFVYTRVEASVVAVLMATTAIWTMAASVFLFGDQFTFVQLLGVVMIFVSIGLLAERGGNWRVHRGLVLGLVSAALFGLATAGWVYVGRDSDVASWTALSFLIPGAMILAYKPKAVLKMKPFFSGGIMARMLLLGGLFSIAALTSLWAFRDGNASLVAALQQTTIVLTMVLAVIFLRERTNLLRKALSAAVCFVAVLLII